MAIAGTRRSPDGACKGTVRAAAAVAALAFLALAAAPAAAHPDVPVDGSRERIAAGESLTIPVNVHYHRLVGDVRAASADARLLVLIAGPDGADAVAGPGDRLTVNALIACCKGTFTEERVLLIANEGTTDVDVTHALVLLHDNVAVLGEDAEPGAIAFTVGVLAAAALVIGRRLVRPAPDDADRARPWALGAVGAHAAMWTAAVVLAAWGMRAYGGGPVAGTLTATASLPATGGDVLTTHAAILLALMILWIASVGLWTAAARRAAQERRGIAFLGLAFAASALVACAAWAFEYGHVLAPLLTLAASAALPVAGALRLLREPPKARRGRRVAAPPPT